MGFVDFRHGSRVLVIDCDRKRCEVGSLRYAQIMVLDFIHTYQLDYFIVVSSRLLIDLTLSKSLVSV